jgi:hypothetical protein
MPDRRACAFETVLAVRFAANLRARSIAVAAILAAWAPRGTIFVVALVVEGPFTSLMLNRRRRAAAGHRVAGGAQMPAPVVVMNLCVFGADAAGLAIGGLQAPRTGTALHRGGLRSRHRAPAGSGP